MGFNMSDWKGLDPGGTEQLWDSTILVDVLEIFKEYEPFSRDNPNSPIFPELQEKYPEITWQNVNADGSFRPIFRKTNPWVKLGLITSDTTNVTVTPLGDELLSGEKLLNEIFTEAAKNFVDTDGSHSFAVMCKAALELPNEIFTLEDVEFAISKTYADGSEILPVAINKTRSKQLTFQDGSRRKRTLRSFMNTLVNAKALVNVTTGWVLNDVDIASEIADIHERPKIRLQLIGSKIPVQKTNILTSTNVKEILAGKRSLPTFAPSSNFASDPLQRALLLEKANSIHESLVEKCAQIIRSVGKIPVEDANTFDVAICNDKILIEVKSLHAANAISQIRKAIAQLPEYRWAHRNIFDETTLMLIVTNENPSKFFSPDYIQYIKEDRGIMLFWQSGDSLVTSGNLSFAEFLTQH